MSKTVLATGIVALATQIVRGIRERRIRRHERILRRLREAEGQGGQNETND